MNGEGDQHSPSRDWVALTLAIGAVLAFNLITVAVLLAAYLRGRDTGDYGLSENATQVLIAGFGGFIGILGGYVGGAAVNKANARQAAQPDQVNVSGSVALTEDGPGDGGGSTPGPPSGPG